MKRLEDLSIAQLRRILVSMGKTGFLKLSKRETVKLIYALTGQTPSL